MILHEMSHAFLVALGVVLLGLPLNHAQVMGPFNIELLAFEQCPDVKVKNPMITNTRYSKVGRKKVVISFDVHAKYPLSDNITQKLDIAIKTQNGFKHNYFNMEGPMVSTGKKYAPQYYNKIKFPLPPGNYSVKNLPVEIVPTLINTFFYGTFKVICTLHYKNELLSCFDFIVTVVPKKKS